MRITHRSVAYTSLQGLNRNLAGVARLQEQLSSGRVLNAPSDSPTGVNRSMQTRSDQTATEQHARSITDAKGWLELTDSVLQTMLDVTREVRQRAVQGLNAGATSPESAQALANDVANLRDTLLGLANQDIQGRPLFGGATSGPQAYDGTGSFVGRTGAPVLRRVSDVETVRVDVTGPEAFGPAGSDLFMVVANIAADLTANPTAVAGHLTALDGVFAGMLNAVTNIGSRMARVERAADVNGDRQLILAGRLAETESVDLPKTIMELQMQQVGYEAALKATAQSIQPTLVDFLR